MDRSWMDMRALLAAQGFQPPDPWLEYARRHGFRRVPGRRLYRCPDCGGAPTAILGQYVYFSHLARLRECGACGLVYSDLRLPAEVAADHFEWTYKEDRYFAQQRAAIFRQLSTILAAEAGEGARVLDAGAATGHLMAELRQRRPDLEITLSDVSQEACRAGARAGFDSVCSDLAGLDRMAQSFDVVVLSDVLYLEPSLHRVWAALPRLVAPGGMLLLRVPNRLAFMRVVQRSVQTLAPARAAAMDRIPLFNPEHLFVFPPKWLRARLHRAGFEAVTMRPAMSLRGVGAGRGLVGVADAGARLAHALLPGRPVLSPSLIMTARRACA